MVIVDKLSRYPHFVGLSHPFYASGVAVSFMDNVHRLHGMAESIVSYRDHIFTSRFWRELAALSGVKLHMSSSQVAHSSGHTCLPVEEGIGAPLSGRTHVFTSC